MDEEMTVGLEQELIADLTAELEGEETFSQSKLISKIRSALIEVYECRKYEDESEEQIQKDMRRQYIKIRKRALFDYNQIGAEGQSSHSENSTSRTYMDRVKYCGDVLPIARIRN